ncbi:MAG: maleylpyruvate isomerase family mycothiol-dependent enzyme [Acidimicrobiia bacterium]
MGEPDVDYSTAYCALRGRVIELVTCATDDQLESYAPATPEWRVRDVLAHLVGVPADVLSGNLDGIATDEWTQAQVDARRDRAVAELVAEWEEHGPVIDPMIPAFGPVAGQFIVDAITHEQDIRGALEEPGARESDSMAIGFTWVGSRVGDIRGGANAGALRVTTESGTHVFGDGEPTATCTTTQFEFLRASTGRRSVRQIETWDWDGDPRLDLLVLPIFTARPDALVE